MNLVFRTDASILIGTGHVMRCLTLANALRELGHNCHFICREHPGHLIEPIRAQGHQVHTLARQPTSAWAEEDAALAHAGWLGCSQQQDAQACLPLLSQLRPQWLIVDHYALDARWQQQLKPYHERLMVIDDLADREHACDLLLDQTFGRAPLDYQRWVPSHCRVLCGAEYSLLRPEFAQLRADSLLRRQEQGGVRQLLVSMGGVDKDNATGMILRALDSVALLADCRIEVVLGPTAPWLAALQQQAEAMRCPTRIHAGISNMAQMMADSDLAIGAAGATAWERCCLGLPAVMVVLAENQRAVAQGLQQVGAARVIGSAQRISAELPGHLRELSSSCELLTRMGQAAAGVTRGQGVQSVIGYLE